MAVTYTTVNEVANLLGFPDDYFTSTSTPKSTQVEKIINRSEDRIDNSTSHAWRSKTITNEYPRPSSIYRHGTGIRFDLIHRTIRSITKLEIWDGNDWVDWIDEDNNKTEGRNKDYWIDYTNGQVYLIGIYKIYPHGIRVTYVFGESVVSGGINECATMMSALQILNSPEFSVVLFTQLGENKQSWSDTKNTWKEEISTIISNNTEFQ